MGLAGAGTADQHRVMSGLGERRFGQLVDQLLIHRRGLEVEAREVAVYRELGRVHLVAHRAHRAVGRLGLQQMFDQPTRRVERATDSFAALLDQVRPGQRHAVQAKLFEFDHQLTHGQPPRGR